MKEEASTFRVMDEAGNTLNFVHTAEKEQPSDSMATRVERRKAEAERKMGQWLATHFPLEKLRVVPCDSIGKPL